MNQYLLLRDNKQTGPYTAEALKAKGLKPYDLVWQEGRSVAWRYPSEIDELKAFAPIVEEQPFDRFYKKPSEQTTGAQATSSSVSATANTVAAQEEQPVQQPTEQAVAKHIYVTMPVTAKQTAVKETKPVAQAQQTNTVTESKPQKKAAASTYIVSEEDDEQNSHMLAGYQSRKKEDDEINNSFLSDYESRKAAFTSQKSGATVAATTTKAAVAEVVEKKQDSFSYAASSRKKESIDLKALLAGSTRFLQDNKNLTRTLVACVLILGGVVIGLIINSGHHTTDTQALESLVKEIRDQQNGKNASPATTTEKEQQDNAQHPAASENNEASPSITDQVSAPSSPATRYNTPSQQTIARHAVLKKENNTTTGPIASKPEVIPVSNTNTTPVVTTPAVMEQPKDKPAVNQEALEKARKAIYEQVHLEASAFKVGLLGGVSDLDITVTNNSSYSLDQVAVEIKYFGLEKKLVKSQTLVFSNVPAGKRRTLEVPRTNRGITIDYAVVSINSKVLGLAQTGY